MSAGTGLCKQPCEIKIKLLLTELNKEYDCLLLISICSKKISILNLYKKNEHNARFLIIQPFLF